MCKWDVVVIVVSGLGTMLAVIYMYFKHVEKD